MNIPMPRRLVLLLAYSALLVSVVRLATGETQPARAESLPQFPELLEVGKVAAPSAIVAGKAITFTGALKTKAGQTKARATSACLITSSAGAQCTYTVRTADGQFTAAGFLPVRGGAIPILGGTGSYAAAKGQISRRNRGDAVAVEITLK